MNEALLAQYENIGACEIKTDDGNAVMRCCVATETMRDIDLYAYHDDSEVVP